MPGFPSGSGLTLTNATIPESVMGSAGSGAVRKVDIKIDDGKIAAIADAGTTAPAGAIYDLDDGLVLPCFVDIHTHLDKGHIWPRKQNPDGTWLSALLSVKSDRERNWAADDVERRMDFALRCAYAHGTAAIRTHLDSAPPQHDTSWSLFETMRDRWAGRIELQAVAIVGPDDLLDPATLDSVARRVQAAGGLMGGSVAVFDRSKEAMLRVVEKAGELGLDLDLHTDETGDPAAHALMHLADAVLETGYKGRVLAGHCCVVAVQADAIAKATINRVAQAGIAVVSLPICNMYLQDRHNDTGTARTPRWRGVTLLNEFRAAGVTTIVASDNTRDPFYAYGDLDMVEVFREGARILQFDHPQDRAWDWLRALTTAPAAHGGFAHKAVIEVGAPADLILFGARTWTELHARPQSDRLVLRAGKQIDTMLPDYRELDDLMEA
jgi:cytosine deaminase